MITKVHTSSIGPMVKKAGKKVAQKVATQASNETKKGPSKLAEFLAKSSKGQWVLEKAADKNLIFAAGFALILTCILRPASIMVLPSKKNKDDQKYAAAQSIASGVIGFAISTLLFSPFQNVSTNLKNKLNKEESADKLLKGISRYYKKDKKGIDKVNLNRAKTAATILERLPDIVFAAPKGILTVALIPPILKYVFGWEKKKNSQQELKQPPIYYGTMNFKRANSNNNIFQNFNGGAK